MTEEQDNYVTDKKYYMDKRLRHYLDMIINEKLSKESEDDALIICEGDEGTGKSSMAGHIGYYISQKTGREFSSKSFFLDTDKMMEFCAKTYRQIIIWDEPAVSGMSDEWWNKEKRKLKKVLTLIRQHQHLYIFNFARFNRFDEFFIVERSIAMVKTFRRNRTELGHFMYFNTKAKEQLHWEWNKKHIRAYEQNALFVGRFFTPLSMFMTPEEYESYRNAKDRAIVSMLTDGDKPNKWREECFRVRYKLAMVVKSAKTIKSGNDALAIAELNSMDVTRWMRYPLKYPTVFKKIDKSPKESEENSINSDEISNISPTQSENDVQEDELLAI